MDKSRIGHGIGPRRAGGRYFSAQWQQEYDVLAIDPTRGPCGGTWSVTVRWADGRTTTHCTAWDARRDRVVSQAARKDA